MLFRPVSAVLVSSLAFFLFGCSGSDDDDASTSEVARLQIINAIPDSPTLAISVDEETGDDDDDETVSSVVRLLSFMDATSTIQSDAESVVVGVTFEDPDSDADIELLDELEIALVEDSIHYLVLTGSFAIPSIELVTRAYGDLDEVEEEDVAEVQVINASTLDPAVVNLVGTTGRTFTLFPGASSTVERLDVSDDYRLELDHASGDARFEIEALSFAERARSLVVVVDRAEGGPMPIVVSALGASTVFSDESRPTYVRVLNTMPDTSQIELMLNDAFGGPDSAEFSLDYLHMSLPFEVRSETSFINVDVREGTDAFETVVSINPDSNDVLILGGRLRDETAAATVTSVRTVAPATQVSLMVLNAADVQVLDDDDEPVPLDISFHVLEAGEGLSESSADAAGLDHLDSREFYAKATPSVVVATRAGTNDIVAGPVALPMLSGTSVLVVVVEAPGGGRPLSLLIQELSQ